ncbi:MAG: SHOCT domain-containing protein [Rhodoferax sp.]|nr:SHOCT domain-containing protein [Rhodoferax sp.]
MSQADELEKLSQLKEKGVLSAEEFSAKKAEILNTSSPKVKKSRRLFWAIPLLIIGTISLLNALGSLSGHTGPVSPVSPASPVKPVDPVGNSNSSKLQCDSAVAKDTLQRAFDQSQFARTMNLSAVLISDVKEQSREAKTDALVCRATITLNTTRKAPVSYRVEQTSDGQFLLTFQVLDDTEGTSTTPVTPSTTRKNQATPAPADFVTRCVDDFVTKFRKEVGEDIQVRVDMLDEWEAQCKNKFPR